MTYEEIQAYIQERAEHAQHVIDLTFREFLVYGEAKTYPWLTKPDPDENGESDCNIP